MKLAYLLLAGLTLLLPAVAGAQKSPSDVAPDQLVKNVTSEVLEIIRTDKDIQSGNSKRVIDLVEAKVLSHFNFAHMTRLAMARDWRVATPAQQKTLTDEFRTLLVRTYSKALTEYKSQTIEYKPFSMKPGESEVKVRTQVIQSGAKPIPLDYFLEQQPQGWKVFDIEVGGISLVTNYRESFASEVRKNGVDGLIKSLQTKNRGTEKQ
ncbi:MAG: ABC transporter substrate-binding protein [Sterolibacterium sp.]|jgi:phospholipid transport system substrate-binding protein